MKNRCLVLFLLVFGSLTTVMAQQEGQFTQFMFNKLYFNPAYAGIRGVPTVGVIYRNQWLGFDGAPVSMQGSFNTSMAGQKVGIGLTAYQQKVGISTFLSASLSYSYSLIRKERVQLKMGVQGTFESFSLDFLSADNIVRELGDPSFGSEKAQTMLPNVGAGLYFTYNDFYVGVSVPGIIKNEIGFNTTGTTTAHKSPHVYTMLGLGLTLSEDIQLLPATLVKMIPNGPLSVDVNLGIEFFQKVTIGGSYRMGSQKDKDSIDFLGHFLIANRLGLGLSYDNPISELKDFTKGSVEVLLQYDLRKRSAIGSGTDDLSNPRFFF